MLDGHHSEKAWTDEGTGVRVIPCPEQTKGVTCVECKLCMNDTFLRDSGAAIGLAAHGTRKAKVVEALIQIGG